MWPENSDNTLFISLELQVVTHMEDKVTRCRSGKAAATACKWASERDIMIPQIAISSCTVSEELGHTLPCTHGANLPGSSTIERFNVLLHLLLIDKCALISTSTESHIEQPGVSITRPNLNSPLSLHAQLSLDDLDEVFAVHSFVSLFEQEDLFVCATKEDLVEQIFMRAYT
jgi:hypothetical protein